MLVSSADTATPASINVAAFERRPRPPISHVHDTAAIAPERTRAAASTSASRPPSPTSTIANVAPEPRARGDPEQVGIGQGVAKDALVGPAGDREHRPREQPEHHSRGAQLPDDRRLQTASACCGRCPRG